MPPKSSTRLQQLKKLLKVALPLAIICLVLIAFLLLPLLLDVKPRYYSSTYKYYLEETYGGVYKNLTDAFSLSAVEVWGYIRAVDVVTGVALPDLPTKLISLALFSLAYCTVFIRRDKYAVFFLASAVVTTFVAKGPYPPFGFAYLWAWLNVPYFAVFRAANRWIMMACMSHSFFIALLVDILTRYVKEKKYRTINGSFSKFETSVLKVLRVKTIEAPIDVAKTFFRRLHKILHYASIILLIAIFLNGFFLTWYFLKDGLQVYSPQENIIEPYEWIGTKDEDFKVTSVNRDPARWMCESSSGYDFAFSAMLTQIGWAHDVGYESSFIHDKPSMQDGGWDENARDFMSYLRFRLVGQQKTRDFLKMTGLFNYRYVVLPAYLDSDVKEFFLNQNGASTNIVYNENGSLIIDNPYYTPRFFATPDYANVLGGFSSFSSLSKIGGFAFNHTDLFFLDKLGPESLKDFRSNATALMFVNANLNDLVMLQLRNKATIINAADFGVYSVNATKYWIQSSSWRDIGALVYGGKTITTAGNVTVEIPCDVSSDGAYDFWLRVGFVSHRGTLQIWVDNNYAGEIRPETDYWNGLVWVKVQNLDLKRGTHWLKLTNQGPGYNDVDAIAVVEPTLFQSTYDELLNSLEKFQGRIVDIMSAVNLFAYHLSPGWAIHLQQFEDDLLEATDFLTVIRESSNVSASSVQHDLVPQNVVDGSLKSRWASDPSEETSQWLQLQWPAAKEVAGVRIAFETAYAQNYSICTWNGTSWIEQVQIVNNTSLSPLHLFSKPVVTTRLLLNVTAYGTPHHLVSIFEFEPCAFSSINTHHFILKQGRYMVALRLATGPEYGTLNLRIANNSLSFNSNNTESGFKWFEAGPLHLERGDQNFSVSANGRMIFDQMILYSLTDTENGSALQNLFNRTLQMPAITYTKLNQATYSVHVKTESPFFLTFSEAYHPLWKARLDDGDEISPSPAYSVVNSFYVNKTGEFDITVFFEGQKYVGIGLRISLLSLIIIVTTILMPRRMINTVRKRLTFRRENVE
jgi:hypothetical protein